MGATGTRERRRPVFGETTPAEAGVEPGKIDPARMAVLRARPVGVRGSLAGDYLLLPGEELDAHELTDLRLHACDWGVLDGPSSVAGGDPAAAIVDGEGEWGYLDLLLYDPIRFAPYTDLAVFGGVHYLLRIGHRVGAVGR